ncbi:MAG: 3-phosphoshikimate 1-carboxyvinyltransferase, partial [Bdellovibrionota bacterium]
EPVGRIHVRSGSLRGITVSPTEVPSLIDELPLLAVLASQAEGTTLVTGAEELRVKETDRIEAIAVNLRALGGEIEVLKDGFKIRGRQQLRGAAIQSFHDHRIAMAFSIAALTATGETTIHGAECVEISYPEFYTTLTALTGGTHQP